MKPENGWKPLAKPLKIEKENPSNLLKDSSLIRSRSLMIVQDIDPILSSIYGAELKSIEAGLWQIETAQYRLLVLLSEDQSWLRMMIPIAPAAEAEPFLELLMENNFDETGEARYGLHQDALWAVFQQGLESLSRDGFLSAIAQLVRMQEQGLSHCFDQFVDRQVTTIIRAAKQQDMTLDMTVQNLDRFYQEGVMGDLDTSAAEREGTLAAWRERLERLWPLIDVSIKD
jgi:Tir chaperone protein (CesT) family